MTRIEHDFTAIAHTACSYEIGAGGNWVVGCICDNCMEARNSYVPPQESVSAEVGFKETFEEFWERTSPERKRQAELTWANNCRVKEIEEAKAKQ